jgi:Cys-tRNA(Pro)/Cys-tRNA(Cys) deacylase
MKEKLEKTNVMRVLDHHGIAYESYSYDNMTLSSSELADSVGVDRDGMFKTLVTVGKSGQNYVFMVPSAGELDLKKAAQVTGEKSIEMIPQKALLPLTGYIHGGCSPIGMKKQLPTFIDRAAEGKTHIAFSGGKVGRQVKMAPAELYKVINVKSADIAK